MGFRYFRAHGLVLAFYYITLMRGGMYLLLVFKCFIQKHVQFYFSFFFLEQKNIVLACIRGDN